MEQEEGNVRDFGAIEKVEDSIGRWRKVKG